MFLQNGFMVLEIQLPYNFDWTLIVAMESSVTLQEPYIPKHVFS